jgi:hypothetical protein
LGVGLGELPHECVLALHETRELAPGERAVVGVVHADLGEPPAQALVGALHPDLLGGGGLEGALQGGAELLAGAHGGERLLVQAADLEELVAGHPHELCSQPVLVALLGFFAQQRLAGVGVLERGEVGGEVPHHEHRALLAVARAERHAEWPAGPGRARVLFGGGPPPAALVGGEPEQSVD